VLAEFPKELMSMLYIGLFGTASNNTNSMSTNFDNDELSPEVSSNNIIRFTNVFLHLMHNQLISECLVLVGTCAGSDSNGF
jgi:hypothetical protein